MFVGGIKNKYMKLKVFMVFFGLIIGRLVAGQDVIPKDSLVADFRLFVKYLEATHPDPYSGFGGKVFFHKKVRETEQQLEKQDRSSDEFIRLVSAFIAPLGDGHTNLSRGDEDGEISELPVRFRVVSDGIVLAGLPDSLRSFLGCRLIALDGVSVEQLFERTGQVIACENRYGCCLAFARNAAVREFLKSLSLNVGEKVRVSVETPEGSLQDLMLPFLSQEVSGNTDMAFCPAWEKVEKMPYMGYGFLDDGRQIMYFRLKSVMAREAYDYMYRKNWGGFDSQLRSFYEYTLQKKMPENMDEAIAGIPAMAEEFRDMLVEMKKHNTPYLIIDLRGNGGGFTPITLPTIYQMYGDRYLETDMSARFYRMLSPLYMQKINMSLDDFNKQYQTSFDYGDYLFDDSEPADKADPERLRENFINQTLGNAKEVIGNLNGKPVYTPEQVFVITDAATFSAAFHYAFYLWKMGATIIGVPSSQAPNTFMEATFFELPRTKVKGSISNSAQYFLSPADKRAKTFYPDMMPAYADYARYGFDKHAEVMYLMDYLNKE